MGQKVAVGVPEDDVGDDLLKAGIVLDLRTRLEKVPLADQLLMSLEVLADESVPCTVGKNVISLYAQDLFGAGTHAATWVTPYGSNRDRTPRPAQPFDRRLRR